MSLSWSHRGKKTNKQTNTHPARQFQEGLTDSEASPRETMALFLLGPLSGCGFCSPRVSMSLGLPPAPAVQRGVVIVSIPPNPPVPRKMGWGAVTKGVQLSSLAWLQQDTSPFFLSWYPSFCFSRQEVRNLTPERSLRFPVQALGGGPHTFFFIPLLTT